MNAKSQPYMSGSLRLTWGVVLFALASAVGFSVILAWERFSGPKFVFAAMLLAATAVAEVLFWHRATAFWIDRRAGAAFLACVAALFCSFGTLYTNYSTSAISQDSNASHKLSAFNVSGDLDKGISEKAERVDILQKQLAAAPLRTSEAAQAAIDAAKADKFWTRTDGCREKKGAQTKAFCDAYAQAVADKSNASAAVQARAELANEQTALAGLREKRGTSESVATAENPTLGLWSSAGFDDRQARVADSMVMMLVGQILLLVGGVLLAVEHAADKEPKSWLPGWLLNWFKSGATLAATGRQLRSASEVYDNAAEEPEHALATLAPKKKLVGFQLVDDGPIMKKYNEVFGNKPAS